MSSLVSKVIVDGSECDEVKCGATNYESIGKNYQALYKDEDIVDLGGGVTYKASTITFKDIGGKYEYILQQSCNLYYKYDSISYDFNWEDAKNSVLEIPIRGSVYGLSIFLKVVDNNLVIFYNLGGLGRPWYFYYNRKTFIVDEQGIDHYEDSFESDEKQYLKSREEEFAHYAQRGRDQTFYSRQISCSRQAKVPKYPFKRLTYLVNEDSEIYKDTTQKEVFIGSPYNDICNLKYYFWITSEGQEYLISLTKFLYNKERGEEIYYGNVTDNSIIRVVSPLNGKIYAKKPVEFTADKDDLLNSKHKFHNMVFYYGTTTNKETGMFYVNGVYAVRNHGNVTGDNNSDFYDDYEAVDIEADNSYLGTKFYNFFHGISTSPVIYRTVSRLYVN